MSSLKCPDWLRTHPVSCSVGIGGSSSGVKWVNSPHPSIWLHGVHRDKNRVLIQCGVKGFHNLPW